MGKLNKAEIIEKVSEKTFLSKRDATEAVETTFELIEQALLNDEEVNITNFGVFTPKIKKGRIGTDPKTHEQIKIKSKRSILFRVSKTLKDKLN